MNVWVDPGFDVTLFVTTDLRTMTAIWMGQTAVREARSLIDVDGDRGIPGSMQTWQGLDPFAAGERMVS